MKRENLPVCIQSLAIIFIIISCTKEDLKVNKQPVAIAGIDQYIALPVDSIWLDGSNSSDPDGKVIAWHWTKISGPTSFLLRNEFAPNTVAAMLDSGVYQFELKVTDSKGMLARDTMRVIVNDRFNNNRPPIADAGVDAVLTFPKNDVYLNGDASIDPDAHKLNYSWKKISGPSPGNIINPDKAITHVNNLERGNYIFELKVTDEAGLFDMDSVNVYVVSCDNSIRPFIDARLISIGTLAEVRSGVTVASAGNKIVFAGAALSEDPGMGGYGSSMVDIYDIVTQTWTNTRLSQRRSHIAAVTAGDKIFLAGGRLGDGAFDQLFSVVDIYDVSTNSWSSAQLSEKRAFIAAATVGNKVFFAGGEKDMAYNTTTTVDIYDLLTGTWSVSYLSEPRAYISAVTVDNKVYFAGGHREDRWYSDPTSQIDIYDNATNTWSVSRLYRPMGNLGGIAVDSKIYWTEGCNVEIKDVKSWNSSFESLSHPAVWDINQGSNPVVANGKIVFMRQWEDDVDKFDIYDIKTDTWSVGKLPVKIQLASVISVNNVIYIAGGNVLGKPELSGQVWRLEF